MDIEVYKFISDKYNLRIDEINKCKWCGKDYAIFNVQKDIQKKIGVVNHELSLCYSCNMRKLMMFRNEINIYNNKCSKCNKQTISIYPPESKEIIYCVDCYDSSDFVEKGDLNLDIENIEEKAFELYKNIPKKAIINEDSENAQFANYIKDTKNIYLSYLVYVSSENIFYSYYVISSSNCIDCYGLKNVERSYECINTIESYNCFYSDTVSDSSDCYFCINIENSRHCLFCSNMVGREYCIYNKQYTKEEYNKIFKIFIEKLQIYKNVQEFKKDFEKLVKNAVYKGLVTLNNESSLGNCLSNSKNAYLVFYCDSVEDSINTYGGTTKTSINIIGGGNVSRTYNSSKVGTSSTKIIGTYNVEESSNVFNSQSIIYSSNVIYSFGLKNKHYCILNKEYSKKEYENISKEIFDYLKNKNTFGDFFSLKYNGVAYNDSSAYYNYPIYKIVYPNSKEIIIDEDGEGTVFLKEYDKFLSKAVLDLGGEEKIDILWKIGDKEVNIPDNANILKIEDFPERIKDFTNEDIKKILAGIFLCKETKRPFRIIKEELDFYKKNNLTIPRLHPKIRLLKKLNKQDRRELKIVKCFNCSKDTLTAINNPKEFKIFCQDCYDKKFY